MSWQQRPPSDDPFIRVALPFILGVVMGFSLILMGFIFLFLAGLSYLEPTNQVSGWVWLGLGLGSELVGIFLMRRSLRGSPSPGTFGPGTKK